MNEDELVQDSPLVSAPWAAADRQSMKFDLTRFKDLALVPALVALVIVGACGFTVSVSVALPVPPLLMALIVTVEVAAAVGVPEINPVAPLTVSPAGNPAAP